ncbi:MAG: hypothetical protein H6668_18480 [Ardenticatenaceae bacterium]|nr:hypothetical protein [Ardenticatenaceae bacterium]
MTSLSRYIIHAMRFQNASTPLPAGLWGVGWEAFGGGGEDWGENGRFSPLS